MNGDVVGGRVEGYCGGLAPPKLCTLFFQGEELLRERIYRQSPVKTPDIKTSK